LVESILKPAIEKPVVAAAPPPESRIEPKIESIEPVVEEPPLVTSAGSLVGEKVGRLMEPPAKKTPKAEPSRPKPVADRPAKLTASQLQDLIRKQAAGDRLGDDRLGALPRWARSDAPRAAKSAAVTSDDVRALISSLAVPSSVASVTYPRGVRVRRVRVPLSSDPDNATHASA
jgi:hypothetical protein